MIWLSVDPATKTGIARWDGETLLGVGTMRPPGAKEAKTGGVSKALGIVYASPSGVTAYPDRARAWASQLVGVSAVVIEEAMGYMPKSVAQLAFRRGYIAALCEARGVPYIEVNTREWRRVAGERFGVNFPTKSEPAKALAISLVREHYGIDCTDDEADAVLVGHWCLRTRALEVGACARSEADWDDVATAVVMDCVGALLASEDQRTPDLAR